MYTLPVLITAGCLLGSLTLAELSAEGIGAVETQMDFGFDGLPDAAAGGGDGRVWQ